jgi:pilus assembly protein Flp/PilA
MKEMLKRLVVEEEGATMVEYGLIVALIAVVVMVAVEALGGAVSAKFTEVTTKLSN